MMAVPIPREHLPAMWPHVRRHLERAAAASGWDEGDLDIAIESGTGLIWAVFDGGHTIGAAMTGLQGEDAHVALVGGLRWREWRGELRKVEAWAREAGCKWIVADGRRGWARVLAADGYTRRADGVLAKDLW